MQNSIWKLTALAGVIGIGFLIALQTQSSLEKDKATAQTESASQEPASSGVADNATGLWPSQSEPATEPTPNRSPRRFKDDVRLTSNEEPRESSANRRANADEFESFAGQRRRPETAEPTEFTPDARSRSTLDYAPRSDRDPFTNNSEPEFGTKESAKAQALRLMKEAQEAINAGQLQSARALAMEALDLPVVYGTLEDRPEQLLAQIDALMKRKKNKPAVAALTEDDLPSAESLATLKSTKSALSDDQAPPALKSDLSDEPFNPTAEEPKPRTSSFENEEPKATLTKTDEETLPLPDLDSSEKPSPKTNISKATEDVPRLSLNDDLEPAPLKPKRPVVEEPQTKLVIRKDAPATARLGEAMIYSMTVENRGVVNAAEVTVEDTVPGGCELVGSNPQAEQSGKKLIWKLGRIEAGKSKIIRVKVIPREEGDIGTVARVISVAETQSEIVPASRLEAQPIQTGGKVRLTVTGPERVRVGETATLKFKLSNPNDEPLGKVTLQNLIPAGFKHPDGNDLSYPVDELGGRQSIEVELELKAIRAGQFINRSVISMNGRVQSESDTRIEIIDARGLRVETSDSGSMPIGQPTVQEIRLINEATIAATGVVIIDTLPSDLRFVKATHGGQYDPVSRKVRWELDSIPANETALLKLTVQPKTAGPHSCVIEVNQSGQQKQEAVESRVKARGISGLRLDIDHNEPSVLTGDDFTVEVRLKNRGNGADSNVELSLLLPPELEFVQARGPVRNRPAEVGRGQGKLISFQAMPEFGEQANAVFEMTLRAKAPGKAKMRAEVTSDEIPEAIAAESVIVVLDANP